MRRAYLLPVLTLLIPSLSRSADWPQHRADARRSGHQPEPLAEDVRLHWSLRLRRPPRPAWPRFRRLRFDHAAQPVVAEGRLFLGSSADGRVLALDAATGDTLWVRHLEAPVRVAPAVWRKRVFVGCDDGHLHCLDAAGGTTLWRVRGGPSDRKVLGNSALVSLWPVRGGPVVADDRVYFGAGIWPTEGIHVHALDAATGKAIWVNRDAGSIHMGQPHGGAYARSGITAQGHLAVAGDFLVVPTGRAVPAVLDRSTGELAHFHLQRYGQRGECVVAATDTTLVCGGYAYELATGRALGAIGRGGVCVPEAILVSGGVDVAAFTVEPVETTDRKGHRSRQLGLRPKSRTAITPKDSADGATPGASRRPLPSNEVTVIAVGDTLVVGRRGRVDGVSPSGARRWRLEIDGTPHGLAAAGGCLFVSTDLGELLCYGPPGPGLPRRIREADETAESDETSKTDETIDDATRLARRAATEILRSTGVSAGWCVDLGCGDGSLAEELALRSDLRVVAVATDDPAAEAIRRRLDRLGLLGDRVMVVTGRPDGSDLPPRFADLLVSASTIRGRTPAATPRSLLRLARPWGGTVCVGRPDRLRTTTRGAHEGAGEWTHQYGGPGNSGCSGDDLVREPLTMIWYRDVDQDMPQRHGRGPSPLYHRGRVVSQGLDSLVALDAFNGRLLWRIPTEGTLAAYDGDHLMGTSGTGSNLCADAGSVFLREGDHCRRIDAATGGVTRTYSVPAGPDGARAPWGYLATAGGILFGSTADTEHVVTYRYLPGGDLTRQLTESTSLFARDVEEGRLLWSKPAQYSLRHNAIAVGGGMIFAIDRPLAVEDRVRKGPRAEHPTGTLLARDVRTGEVLWQTEDAVWGTVLIHSAEHDTLLMAYQDTRFKLASEVGGRLAAFRASSGDRIWDREARYTTRPVVVQRQIIALGGAWDLLTGEAQDLGIEKSYGCGQIAGSSRLLVYRSATLGYLDLAGERRNRDYGGIRPGCWINALPAGGMVLMPDATEGCKCSYLNASWVALGPAAGSEPAEEPPADSAR